MKDSVSSSVLMFDFDVLVRKFPGELTNECIGRGELAEIEGNQNSC